MFRVFNLVNRSSHNGLYAPFFTLHTLPAIPFTSEGPRLRNSSLIRRSNSSGDTTRVEVAAPADLCSADSPMVKLPSTNRNEPTTKVAIGKKNQNNVQMTRSHLPPRHATA